ncbi:hypothetical protein GQ457_15G022900 [Hibiscus cannabinus]
MNGQEMKRQRLWRQGLWRQGSWRQKQASEHWRGRSGNQDQWRLQTNQDNHARRSNRQGVSVFINYVSKRIQPSTLRKTFQEYGNVIDVYIAYYNPRRIRFESTFTFVRLSTVFEAMNAVELANNRKMDGFSIRVYLDRKPSVVLKGYKEEPINLLKSIQLG